MKSFKEFVTEELSVDDLTKKLDELPNDKKFDFGKDITKIFKKSSTPHNQVLVDYEKGEDDAKITNVDINKIQITQPVIIPKKVLKNYNNLNINNMPPIPAVKYGNNYVIPDGHHRLTLLHLLGKEKVKLNLVDKNS